MQDQPSQRPGIEGEEDQGPRRLFLKTATVVGAAAAAGVASSLLPSQAQAQERRALVKEMSIKEKVAAARLKPEQTQELAKNAITMEALKIAETLGGAGAASIFSLSFGLKF